MKIRFLVMICLAPVLMTSCILITPTATSPSATPLTASSSIVNARPSGTYVATVFGLEQSLTFRGDIMERCDRLGGKEIFRYTISEDGSRITATNVVTGATWTSGFKYLKEFECVAIDYGEDGVPLQYYRK